MITVDAGRASVDSFDVGRAVYVVGRRRQVEAGVGFLVDQGPHLSVLLRLGSLVKESRETFKVQRIPPSLQGPHPHRDGLPTEISRDVMFPGFWTLMRALAPKLRLHVDKGAKTDMF